MKKAIAHFRGNVIGYLALFVALGGTSYAAANIPANSVGTRQLRNGAVTPAKLNGSAIAGHVAFWAQVDGSGHVLASSKPAVTAGWGSGGSTGTIQFHGQLPTNCFALADITSGPEAAAGFVAAANTASIKGETTIQILMRNVSGQGASLPVVVADICP
jgi:hypothetical protein